MTAKTRTAKRPRVTTHNWVMRSWFVVNSIATYCAFEIDLVLESFYGAISEGLTALATFIGLAKLNQILNNKRSK